ncbi:hypothetical protein V6N12_055791, partial [Hibiscus sabdariffa]
MTEELQCANDRNQNIMMIKQEDHSAGRTPDSAAVNKSDLYNRLLDSSSLVSTPVFFIFGEATKWDVPSLKAAVVLTLSAYVENLRGSAKDASF